jgi:hypothetical protein
VTADEPLDPDQASGSAMEADQGSGSAMDADRLIGPPTPDSTGSGVGGRSLSDADGHLGWRLSALLDGELGVTEELVAREHLTGCDVCQDEFAEVMAARAFVRGLGDVEPPQGYIDRVITRAHRRNQTRLGLVSLVAIAALWIVVLIVGAGVALPQVVPHVQDFVAQHEIASADPSLLPTVEDARALSDDEAATYEAPYVFPQELAAGFEQVAAYDKGEGLVQVLYRSGDATVSLFEQEGTLDWGSLPDIGEVREVDGQEVWVGTLDDGRAAPAHLVVVPADSVVYTLVTTDEPETAVALAPDLPDPQDYTWSDRAKKKVEGLVRSLGID